MSEVAIIAYLMVGAVIGLFSLCVDHNAPEDIGGVTAWYVGHVVAWPAFMLFMFAYNRGRFGP